MTLVRGPILRIFREKFGSPPTVLCRTPGRVNLIGEHTDYNDGYVLPMTVDREVLIAVRRRDDTRVRIHSLDYAETHETDLRSLRYSEDRKWANYPMGALWALQDAGLRLTGLDLAVTGDIPQGSGLSSSAAIEVCTTLAACLTHGLPWEAPRMALLSQRAENQFVGVHCGIMDQMAVAAAAAGHALFLDCRSLEFVNVPVAFRDAQFVVVDSGVHRVLRGSEYNTRRRECEAAVEYFRGKNPAVKALRDVSPEDHERHQDGLPDKPRRRSGHVIFENERVLRAKDALGRGDAEEFGRLMTASHASMRDLFEISCPELDALVEIALGVSGVYGARLTGAGFGGCTVHLVRGDAIDRFRDTLMVEYRKRTGREAVVMPCAPSGGACAIEL